MVGGGCGRSLCWTCGKKFCGQYIDPSRGTKTDKARDHHDAHCCVKEEGYKQEDYCPGGHNSHCEKRFQ